jgi:hypothetical protein
MNTFLKVYLYVIDNTDQTLSYIWWEDAIP